MGVPSGVKMMPVGLFCRYKGLESDHMTNRASRAWAVKLSWLENAYLRPFFG